MSSLLHWAVVFLPVALVAPAFDLGGLAGDSYERGKDVVLGCVLSVRDFSPRWRFSALGVRIYQQRNYLI